MLARARVFIKNTDKFFMNYPMYEQLIEYQIQKKIEKDNNKSNDDILTIQGYQKELVQGDLLWVYSKVNKSYF